MFGFASFAELPFSTLPSVIEPIIGFITKGKGTEVTFYGYANKQAREDGKQPLSSGKVQIAGDEYVAGADRAALYAIIKQRPEFEGAEDA